MSESSIKEESSDRFDYWWNIRGESVEPPNERRGGQSGVELVELEGQTLYCKRQQGHLYRSLRYPLGRPTVLREVQVIPAFRQLEIPVPDIHFSGARYRDGKWQGVLITQALSGYVNLGEWYAADHPRDQNVDGQVLRQLAANLARLHRSRWQHGCLYPKHVFVKAGATEVSVALLDLEKSRRRITSLAAARHDLRQLYRHWGQIPFTQWQILINHYLTLVPDRRRQAICSDGLSSTGG